MKNHETVPQYSNVSIITSYQIKGFHQKYVIIYEFKCYNITNEELGEFDESKHF